MPEIQRILVIRVRRLGDAILTLPLLHSLKRTFPSATIDFVVNEPIDNLFATQPIIDKVIKIPIAINKGSFLGYIKWVRQTMQNTNYDLIIDCRSTFKTMIFSLFSLNTPIRIGLKKKYNKFVHNRRMLTNSNLNKIEELCSLMDPLKEFNIQKDFSLELFLSEETKLLGQKKLEESGINLTQPIIFCNVVTRDVSKQWPLEEMKKVIDKITIFNPNFQLIFNYSGESEKKMAQELYNSLENKSKVYINIEIDSLQELLGVMAASDFFFGNEGGARHVADGLNIASFSIFSQGVSIEKWIRNRNDKNDAIANDGALSAEIVWNQLQKKLTDLNN